MDIPKVNAWYNAFNTPNAQFQTRRKFELIHKQRREEKKITTRKQHTVVNWKEHNLVRFFRADQRNGLISTTDEQNENTWNTNVPLHTMPSRAVRAVVFVCACMFRIVIHPFPSTLVRLCFSLSLLSSHSHVCWYQFERAPNHSMQGKANGCESRRTEWQTRFFFSHFNLSHHTRIIRATRTLFG